MQRRKEGKKAAKKEGYHKHAVLYKKNKAGNFVCLLFIASNFCVSVNMGFFLVFKRKKTLNHSAVS